jgi:Tol biopolymer transport system component
MHLVAVVQSNVTAAQYNAVKMDDEGTPPLKVHEEKPPLVDGLLENLPDGDLEEPSPKVKPEENAAKGSLKETSPITWPIDIPPTEPELKTETPEIIEPLWVRALTGIEAGHNDSNPVWSPSGELIAFERSTGDKKVVIITDLNGSIVKKVYLQLEKNDDEMEFFLSGISEEASYNAGLTWSHRGDRFVVMSNGGSGNYDLFLGTMGSEGTPRLTESGAKDGLAHWSPVDDLLIFVSGRTGKGDLYLMDLTTNRLKQLTRGDRPYLYPRWSPDGEKIALIYGSNENHDIYLIPDMKEPLITLKPLSLWPYDDLRPVWSPDGKKIAFYTNYNKENDPKEWSLVVIASDGSDPKDGEGLVEKIVATDVVPDIAQGPTWMPDSNRIVFVKNDRKSYNPIYIIDIHNKSCFLIQTDTKMNHDLSCSVDGTIAFRAQVEQWDHIHIAKLKE